MGRDTFLGSLFVCAAMALSQTFALNALPAMAGDTFSQTKKPVIGINIDVSGDENRKLSLPGRYVDAITKSGGIAVIVPPMKPADFAELLPSLDGMLMIGGEDYPPSVYGQAVAPKTVIMKAERSDFDLLVARTVLAKAPMPYLGICAGSQVLNIASGGELIQDIPTHKPESKVAHSGKDGWTGPAGTHVVTLAKDSKLSEMLQDANGLTLAVPTSHHQCVSKLGKDLVVAATTEDGITEAIEIPGDRFVVGVQWHPERDFERNKELFREFVWKASMYRQSKENSAASNIVK